MYEGLASVYINGDGGRISGWEFSVSATGEIFTDVLRNWGVIFNTSFTDSKVKANPDDPAIDLPGLSDTVANLTLYYENNNFSARINGRYRDDFLGEVSGFGDGRQVIDYQRYGKSYLVGATYHF